MKALRVTRQDLLVPAVTSSTCLFFFFFLYYGSSANSGPDRDAAQEDLEAPSFGAVAEAVDYPAEVAGLAAVEVFLVEAAALEAVAVRAAGNKPEDDFPNG